MAAEGGVDDELDFDVDNDSLTSTFTAASKHLTSLLPLDDQILLVLYGYYKQGTEGPCNVPQPSWYNRKGKAKWEAWKKLGDMPQTQAQTLYIEEIRKLDPDFEQRANEGKNLSWVTISTMQCSDRKAVSLTDYVKDGDCEAVQKELKSAKMDVNALDEDGMGLIHWAADRGNAKILALLLDLGADVNLVDDGGQSALHYAVSCRHLECIKSLLKNGAQRDLRDQEGVCAKDIASDETVKELLVSYT